MNYLMALIILGIAVLIHELGHFLAAKAVGLPIKIFSIGYGPKMIGIERNGTEYRLSWFPLGGYVMMDFEEEEELYEYPVYKRVIMALGGPIGSLILPIICFGIIHILQVGSSPYDVLILPIKETFSLFWSMFIALPQLFNQSTQLSGVVGIVAQGGNMISGSLVNGLYFSAIISTNLALLNLLPIPVLDGGKIILYLLEKISVKSVKLHYPLTIASAIGLLGLMLYVTALDLFNYVV